MSGLQLRYSVDDAVVQKLIKGLRDFDSHPVLGDIGQHMVNRVFDNFQDGKTFDGSDMAASKRAKEQGGKTLVDSGLLRDSYTFSVSGDEVEIGSNDIRAAIHHFGGEIRAKNGGSLAFEIDGQVILVESVTMPARPVLGITDQDEKDFSDLVVDHIRSIANEHSAS